MASVPDSDCLPTTVRRLEPTSSRGSDQVASGCSCRRTVSASQVWSGLHLHLVLMGFHSGWNAAINTFDPASVKIEFIPGDASCTHEFKLT